MIDGIWLVDWLDACFSLFSLDWFVHCLGACERARQRKRHAYNSICHLAGYLRLAMYPSGDVAMSSYYFTVHHSTCTWQYSPNEFTIGPMAGHALPVWMVDILTLFAVHVLWRLFIITPVEDFLITYWRTPHRNRKRHNTISSHSTI